MKNILLVIVLVIVASCATAQVVIYEDDAQIKWDATTTYNGGAPIEFIPGDVMTYEVYFYDYDNPVIDNQDVAQLQFAGSTTNTELDFTFPERRQWAVGVRSLITDGGGTSGPPSQIGWSINEGSVNVAVMGGPFRYVPLIPMSDPTAPENLADQRY